jgi:predicted GNAT family N-acyltransferase
MSTKMPANENAASVSVRVVRTFDDYQAVCALRAIIYMGEQHCPYDEEFDGNDLCGATHLVAYANGQPVGCCRLRWFADCAKLERVCVTKHMRGGGVLRALWSRASEIAARKGYRFMLGHIEARLLPIWTRVAGFGRRDDAANFCFSDREYVQAVASLTPASAPLGLCAPPLDMLRPEGAWDEPGVLDLSSSRNASAR